jgi:hypothetical protein
MSGIAICFIVTSIHAGEDRWKYYHTNPDAGKLYYDTQKIVRDDNVVDVRSKFIPDDSMGIQELQHLVRFDCVRVKWKILKAITTYTDGRTAEQQQNSSFEPVQQDTSAGDLFNEVCVSGHQ